MIIRPTQLSDIADLQNVLNATELFPSEMLPEMLESFLADQNPDELWLTCEVGSQAIGFCYAAAEKFTDGTWNMLAIAVHPSRQGAGAGSVLVKKLEADLSQLGKRVLIVDTSGTEHFSLTREFYRKNGYAKEAVIRDYWAAGDDKIIFWKSLGN